MRNLLAAALLCAASAAGAQSLAQRVTSSDGTVQIVYPSRPSACGDGRTFISHLFGSSTYYSGSSTFNGHGSWEARPCVHGPARVQVSVISGEITRLRAFVGPVPSSDYRTIEASAQDAAAWLTSVVSNGSSHLANDAMLPLVLADVADPWQFFLRVARDENRPLSVRRSALTWLGYGVNDKLGIADERADTDADELRDQAVFALSQRPKSESVPELIDVVRNVKYASARRSAVFWLGQTGDPRAVEVFAELLNRK